ncbi:GNAT family N-acetyltransferase [Actinoplanes solisilvae]|uniref:GNAT family N-acetyltransferase n=1 Tax=Actinoplanes solisilvae TaxID=2486853 RepID=UPI000FD8F2BC|nr:GNAT family N-acetyltransferase [Actinoplanes solisilvae]
MIREIGEPGDLGWVVFAHGELYPAEYGWNTTLEKMVARIMADFGAGYDPAREAGWIAELDGRRVGSVLCVDGGDGVAVLRVLLVHPDARGHGVGGQLVDTCVQFARKAGYSRMRLWTTGNLAPARGLYLSRGFQLVAETPYSEFGPELLGQTYSIPL